MAIERKYERDIDLFLAEEFMVSADFAEWFLQRTRFVDRDSHVVDVFVSKSDSDGESDLVVLYEETETAKRFALLIEDKIDAPFQPDQAARYRRRGLSSVAKGEFEDFTIVLCAPQSYLDAQPTSALFDSSVSYADIGIFLRREDSSPRDQYRASFIERAAARAVNTWVRIDDSATNAFWDAAYELATREFPLLEMKRPRLTAGSSWVTFRPRDMPTQPKHVYVSVKGERGFVDLTFTKTRIQPFVAAIQPLLDQDMSIHQTGASAAVRLVTPAIQISADRLEASTQMRTVFSAAARLIDFYRRHRDLLNATALDASPA